MKSGFAEQYRSLEEWHWWFRGRRHILEAVLGRELPQSESLMIVPVGCGPAEGLTWLLPLAGRRGRVLGLDVDFRHARHVDGRVDFVVGKAEEAPVASQTCDAVLALDVLEHLDDDAAGLREIGRLLKPGGLLLATVPAFPALWGGQDEVSHHRRRYTKRALLDAFARAQLPPPRVTHFNTLLFPPVAAIRWMRRVLGQAHRSRSDFDDGRPGAMNELLALLFSLERHLVLRVPLPVGVSLLAALRMR
jgi:SAM-dependent methyltransferase